MSCKCSRHSHHFKTLCPPSFVIAQLFHCIDHDVTSDFEGYEPEDTVTCLGALLLLFIDASSTSLFGADSHLSSATLQDDISELVYGAVAESCEQLKLSAKVQYSDDALGYLENIISKVSQQELSRMTKQGC